MFSLMDQIISGRLSILEFGLDWAVAMEMEVVVGERRTGQSEKFRRIEEEARTCLMLACLLACFISYDSGHLMLRKFFSLA